MFSYCFFFWAVGGVLLLLLFLQQQQRQQDHHIQVRKNCIVSFRVVVLFHSKSCCWYMAGINAQWEEFREKIIIKNF